MIIVTFILPLLNNGEYRKNGIADDVRFGFLANPVYAAAQAIVDIYRNHQSLVSDITTVAPG